jgi:hypothetical protein
MSGIAPKQNAFKSKIALYKQKSIINILWQEDAPPPPGTPKHNDQSGTDRRDITEMLLSGVQHQNPNPLPYR